MVVHGAANPDALASWGTVEGAANPTTDWPAREGLCSRPSHLTTNSLWLPVASPVAPCSSLFAPCHSLLVTDELVKVDWWPDGLAVAGWPMTGIH